MKEGYKKIIFYVSFSALGVFWAEALSTNIPQALINPFLYLGYGLLYVFFLDALMRWNEKSFVVWYLFGALVGLITENYIAKVTFYGLDPSAFRILGVAPSEIAFIILFYHAFFSFLAPAYLAKRILKVPLPIVEKQFIDVLFVFAPIILIPVIYSEMVMRGLDLFYLIKLLSMSALILILWIMLLCSLKKIENVLLTDKERNGLLVFTFLIYLVFTIKATNKAHGHAPMDIPLVPMIGVSFVIILVLCLIYKKIGQNKDFIHKIEYYPGSINFPVFLVWLSWHLLVTAMCLYFVIKYQCSIKIFLICFGLVGTFLGIIFFVSSIIFLLKKSS